MFEDPRDDHDPQHGALLVRADDRLVDRDAADERHEERERESGPVTPAVVRRQRPGDVRRERGHLALGEVDHAGRTMDQA